jgi:hypothetical protein
MNLSNQLRGSGIEARQKHYSVSNVSAARGGVGAYLEIRRISDAMVAKAVLKCAVSGENIYKPSV